MLEVNNFSRERNYLAIPSALYAREKRVDYIPTESLAPSRMFCLIGSNRLAYDTAMGLSRTFAGNGSDGLI